MLHGLPLTIAPFLHRRLALRMCRGKLAGKSADEVEMLKNVEAQVGG